MIRKMRDEAAAVASSRWNEHAQHKWEREVQAIAFDLLPKRDAYDRAELLAAMDSVPAESKRALSPFAWCAAGLARLVRSKGLVTAEEVLQRVGPGEHVPEGSPKFRPQQLVVVRGDGGTRPSQWRRPYHTMVGFLCGMEGRVVRFEGHARNDEAVGFGAEGSSMREYTIAFPLQDLLATPEAVEAAKGVSLEVEVLECWLEAVDMVDRIQKAWPPPKRKRKRSSHQVDHERGVDYAGAPSPGEEMARGLVALLVEKGLVTRGELALRDFLACSATKKPRTG